jgi:hypothetical protein
MGFNLPLKCQSNTSFRMIWRFFLVLKGRLSDSFVEFVKLATVLAHHSGVFVTFSLP